MGLAAGQQAVVLYVCCWPLFPRSHAPHVCLLLLHLVVLPRFLYLCLSHHCPPHPRPSPYLTFSTFTMTYAMKLFSPFFTIAPMSPPSPSLYSFTQYHYGLMLTEAFIKCQLYTRDHTVEGEDTMISDPKRSTCL